MGWLDPFWIPMEKSGILVPARRKIILGDGITAEDDPDNDALRLGVDGTVGADGATWRNGSGAPSDGTGVDGDYYLRTSNGDVYKKASGTYSVVGNIQGPAGADGADGADATAVPMPWSPVDYMSKNESVGNGSGSVSTGIGFALTEALTITGARFWWGHGTAVNVKVSLWTTDATAGHTRQRNATVAVSGIGLFTATFSSPYTIASTSINRQLYIAMWETTGTRYTQVVPNYVISPALPFIVGKVHLMNFKSYGNGDVEPTSTAASENYPIEPIFA